jgi:hypothetical protein
LQPTGNNLSAGRGLGRGGGPAAGRGRGGHLPLFGLGRRPLPPPSSDGDEGDVDDDGLPRLFGGAGAPQQAARRRAAATPPPDADDDDDYVEGESVVEACRRMFRVTSLFSHPYLVIYIFWKHFNNFFIIIIYYFNDFFIEPFTPTNFQFRVNTRPVGCLPFLKTSPPSTISTVVVVTTWTLAFRYSSSFFFIPNLIKPF